MNLKLEEPTHDNNIHVYRAFASGTLVGTGEGGRVVVELDGDGGRPPHELR